MKITVVLTMATPGMRESFDADAFTIDDKGALHVGADTYVFKAPVTSDADSG